MLAAVNGDRLFARAALTFAAAAATSLTACGKEPTDKPPPMPTSTANADKLPTPAYRPPPMFVDAAPPEPTTTTPATSTAPTAVPAYGVPPINQNLTPKR